MGTITRVIAALLLIVALVGLLTSSGPHDDFKGDNAFGATANNVESIRAMVGWMSLLFLSAIIFFAGTQAELLAELRGLRSSLSNQKWAAPSPQPVARGALAADQEMHARQLSEDEEARRIAEEDLRRFRGK